tara:strand:+ start:194 stop:439 length:246 start_codon:yes stop_codon:yes gene_type:complete
VSECIRSGYCCQRAPCGWGVAEENGTACIYLVGNKPGEYECGKYDEIMAASPTLGADISPAFGAGCCSSLNPVRIKLLERT